jgi:hypothetical protein
MPKINNKYDRTHLRNMALMDKRIKLIYSKAAEEAAKIGVSLRSFNPDKVFSFDDYPETKKMIDELTNSLHNSMEAAVVNGVRSSWTLSNNKNNALSQRVFGDNIGNLTKEQYARYFSSNGAALDAFLLRKQNGLNLSERVWRYTNDFRNEIEMGLDLGIRSGKDAPSMARELKQYLQYPDKLFRRVRDEHGQLQLSKAAAKFHPGRGVYRSSYKNARRLASTEINMAYRTSDYLRWQQMDFVVGIEVKTSNNHTLLGSDGKPHEFLDICDALAGKYPKDFKFTGWHPHCRCHAEPILKTEEEMDEDTDRILNGEDTTNESVNKVEDVPQAFKDHIEKYSDTIKAVDNARLPYYVQDNRARVNEVLGIAVKESIVSVEKAKEYAAIEKALGITQGEVMSFEEANEMRGNPHYAEDEAYRVNCQTCVVANELRRRGFPVEALPNLKGSALEELSQATEKAWVNELGNTPTSRRIGATAITKRNKWSGKTWQVFEKTCSNRSQLVKALESEITEDGRYHISWLWNKSNSGHIITVEKIGNTFRYYDPQSGQVIAKFVDYIKDIDLNRGIKLLRVDNLMPNPEVCTKVLTKAGSKSIVGGVTGDNIVGSVDSSNGIVSLIKKYYTVGTNKEKVEILKQITTDKSFKRLNYHSSKDGSIFGINMSSFDKVLKEKEMPKNLTLAKKLVANKMDVYFLPNPSDSTSADFILQRKGKMYYLEGKTLNGKNSLDHLLNKGAKQAERICVDIVGTTNTNYISENIKKAFEQSGSLKEILLFNGSKLVTVNEKQVQTPNFKSWFKKLWEH